MNKISSYTMLEILNVAGVKTEKTGNSLVCKCPVCKGSGDFKRGDHNAQVNPETLFCYSENKTYTRTEIINELDLYSELDIKEWDDRPTAVPQTTIKPSAVDKPIAPAVPADSDNRVIKITMFDYCDLGGKVLYRRKRIDKADGTKDVPYLNKPKDQHPIFYGIETLADPANINRIIFAEGAKCAEAVRAALADTNAAGDTAVLAFDKPREWENIGTEAQNIILQKKIIIFADNDEPGRQNTAGLLKYLPTAEVVDFSDKPKAYDIADWLSDGGTIAGAIQKYKRTVEPAFETDPDALPAIQIKPVPPEFILTDYMPLVRNDINMLAAFGGHGKTWIALNCGIRAVLSGMRVKYWIREATAGYLRYRLDLLLPLYQGKDSNLILNNLFLADIGKPFDLSATNYHYDLVILDPYLSFFTGDDENKNKENRDFIEPFIYFSNKNKTTFLFLHHAGKNKDSEYASRGASSIIDTFHNVWEIEKIVDSEKNRTGFNKHKERFIVNKKDNMGVQRFGVEHKIVIKPSLVILNNDDSDDENEENQENQTFLKENGYEKAYNPAAW